ncbi:hypothetical protein B0H14DRAFT_2837130 [Mycena olivaceomarginata]|nr:hypothetical protein B0H14DRAFT_2837130 [Mycena olivaceomarginata]
MLASETAYECGRQGGSKSAPDNFLQALHNPCPSVYPVFILSNPSLRKRAVIPLRMSPDVLPACCCRRTKHRWSHDGERPRWRGGGGSCRAAKGVCLGNARADVEIGTPQIAKMQCSGVTQLQLRRDCRRRQDATQAHEEDAERDASPPPCSSYRSTALPIEGAAPLSLPHTKRGV